MSDLHDHARIAAALVAATHKTELLEQKVEKLERENVRLALELSRVCRFNFERELERNGWR